jgi:predicted solute-binding protein
MSLPFRIGSVPYLNAAPLTYGLGEGLVLLPPSRLAVELETGRLDAALLSITEALFSPEHEILGGLGILSRGPVFSVGVAHRVPLDEIRTLHLDPSSCTSVNLLKVLLKSRGLDPALVPLREHAQAAGVDAALLIGNPAIAFRRAGHPHAWWDLGEEWEALEHLPFVYAAWVMRRGSPDSLRQRLVAAAAAGREHREEIIRTASEYDEPFRRAYLGGHVQYDLDEAARAGVRRFSEHLRQVADRPVYVPRFVSVGGQDSSR